MKSSIDYPFVPKSNAALRPGHFFQIPLSNGQFACGVILATETGSRTGIWGGLLDWVSDDLPTCAAIARSKIMLEAAMNVRTIGFNGGAVLGLCTARRTWQPTLARSSVLRDGCRLRRGFTDLGRISDSQFRRLKVAGAWSLPGIKVRAEQRLVAHAA